MNDYIYDIETYPNVFTLSAVSVLTLKWFKFEISYRRNDITELVNFIYRLKAERARMVGFNNNGFDYIVLHYICDYYLNGLTPYQIYLKADGLINSDKDAKFAQMIWDDDRHVEQLDLFKIHHFDNKARSTSLKMIEFNMRSENIEDLPFPPGTFLELDEIPILVTYNDHDVNETFKFYMKSLPLIEFRMKLTEKYGRNFLNHNDTKIGKDYFIMELERLIPGSCYTRGDGGKVPRQTPRPSINLKDAIFPYISFNTPEFERIKNWLASQTITETKGVFKDLSCTVNGFQYDFGVGGIHGSVEPSTITSDATHVIIDVDVTSYYPSLAISNRIYPEHLGPEFCDIYENVKKQRMGFSKDQPENAMLKLALNGVYGDSNNKYSPFYDPLYTMKITINGQLLLCLLAEYVAHIPDLKMIQINTDGLTVRLPRTHVGRLRDACTQWEDFTGLQLEEAIYSRIFIRDVNNYIGENEDGKLKRKGAYAYNREDQKEMPWHKNQSAFVVQKAAEAALVRGEDIRQFILNHSDFMDFMLRTKVPRSSKLVLTDTIAWGDTEFPLQNITRYYISKGDDSGALFKVMPPPKGCEIGTYKRANSLTDAFYNSVIAELRTIHGNAPLPWDERINNKGKTMYEIGRTGVNVGWKVTPCNDIKDAHRDNVDYDWYIQEATKLVKPLRGY